MDGDHQPVHCSDLPVAEDEPKYLREAISALPPEPLKDLLGSGVCIRCIFRLFCLHEQILSRPFLSTPILHATLHELAELEEDGADVNARHPKDSAEMERVQEFQEFKVCWVCVGILQYAYRDDKGILVKKNCACDFSSVIGNYVKQEGHQIDSFSLEVSLPQLVVKNEQAVWLFIRKKYGSESWFAEKFPSESISVKDFLKMSLAKLLEDFLGVKSSESSFRVRLTYTFSDASARNQQIHDSNGCHKRRKIDGLKKCAGMYKDERCEVPKDTSVVTEDDGIDMNSFPLEEVNECCSLILNCHKTSIYVGGRYLKYSRYVSQTRWIIDDERMGEASVEEIVGSSILSICQGDSYKFHAAGREDIDVRMLGTGRPFLVEIQNARRFPSDALIKEIEGKINSLENKFVKVKNLKFLGHQGWELMREGEAEKQKQYAALVWISRPLSNDDQQKLSSFKDMQILQNTPIRVLHRRSPLEREKTIHWIRVEGVAGNSQYFLLHLCTQAGTYIKEFVHGDLGRTHPSLGSILGCRAEILQLDVTDVKMDCFNE